MAWVGQMDLKRLRTFVTVAEQGSVSGASEVLRITQPALSRQVRDLQMEFGVRLFDQVGRRLRLTTEGAELLSACHALLQQADGLLEHARSLGQGDTGTLRVGATPHLIANVLPGFLTLFAARYPRVRVTPVEAGGVDQIEMLRHGDLHAAITILPDDRTGFVAHRILPLTVLAAYNPDSGISFAAQPRVRDLAGISLLLLTPSFGTRRQFDAVCRLERTAPTILMESAAPETLLAFARAGHGVAIVPSTAQIDRRSLRVVPVVFQQELLTIELAVLWDAQRRLPRYAEDFSSTLAAHMATVIPQFEASNGDIREKRGRTK